jgi:hypothetical protein
MPVRQQLAIERANLACLKQRLTDGHPDVRTLRDKVEQLEKLAAAEPPEQGPSQGSSAPGSTPEAAQRRERISSLRAEIEPRASDRRPRTTCND